MADPKIQGAVIRHAQTDMAADPGMSHDTPAPAKPQARKLGAEHLKSMAKLGAHELTQALVALPDSNMRPLEEPGVFGNEAMPHIVDSSYQQSLDHHAARPVSEKDNSLTR